MLHLTDILGYVSERDFAEQLHRLEHAGKVESVVLSRADAKRHRLRVTTDHGTDVAIALARDTTLGDGAVLYLDEDRAIVVRMKEEEWLVFVPRDVNAALELGYTAGHLHWRVRFSPLGLAVAREGPEQTYLDRLRPLLTSGRIQKAQDDESA
ncbi:MAG: urease accessory protein UreE [Deltaproteobacteria bacterium]|nr:urease accessory protein UreE [Deltaproteobacteria bacterium]